jgi:xylulose-5-phosphate/fructose-6-phosphate phosphoketolase
VIFNFRVFPWLIHRLTYYRPHQDHILMRAYNKQGSINTPLELTIRNQSDRFGLTNDAIDCMPRFRVTGSSAHEALLNQQVARKFHAYDFGMKQRRVVKTMTYCKVRHPCQQLELIGI